MAEKILKDKRLINWLNKKGIKSQQQMRDFLNPNFSMLNNPLALKGVKEAVQVINHGIDDGKKFVIVGDYDCDGIMASTIVYQYLLSKNASVEVFIPNRFEDGYGLNLNLAREIVERAKPDILITVDLGVSCYNEIEYLKNAGVQVIVTDHHEPPEMLPDCIVIDPKIAQKYPCSFLCGAGVAYKLVSALGGFEFANQFLDIVAIATIGDIVPLLDENRVIASIGLEKLNNKHFSLKSIKYLIGELKLENISSTDVYLKLVPKINASGRMDNGKKVFDFLNSAEPAIQQKLLAEIMADNALRLEEINKSVAVIEQELKKIDILKTPILCVHGEFHQGILGILASRVVADFGRPAIVFTATENGTLKASGRSVEGVDLHAIVAKNADLCIHFGGHKMALGLEIAPENYDKFVRAIEENFKTQTTSESPSANFENDDIVIDFADINSDFIAQVNMLAPFGCNNEKPGFKIVCEGAIKTEVLGTKNNLHLKLKNEKNANVIYFFGSEHRDELSLPTKKEIFVDIDFNYFKNKATPQGIVKKIQINSPKFICTKQKEKAIHAVLKSLSLLSGKSNQTKQISSLTEISATSNFDNNFGTLVFGFNDFDSAIAYGSNMLTGFSKATKAPLSLANTVVLDPTVLVVENNFSQFSNLVFLSQQIDGEFDCFDQNKVFVLNRTTKNYKIDQMRTKCGLVYSLISKNMLCGEFANIIDFCQKGHKLLANCEPFEVAVIALGLYELGLISLEFGNTFVVHANENNQKKNLEESKILEWFKK